VSIVHTTISGNSSNNGAGISFNNSNQISTLNLSNSTISDNIGSNGGGIIIQSVGNINILNCTISNNVALNGGGIRQISPGIITIGNTIVANNTNNTGSPRDVSGIVTSLGNNLIGDGSGSGVYIGSDLVGTNISPINPLLGPLINNGGPTLTRALLPGSPAIDAGSNLLVTDTYDQRGPPFFRTSGPGPRVDIGAFELQQIVVCCAGDSVVLTKNILTDEVKEIRIADVYSDRHLVFDTESNSFVPIKYNIVTGKNCRFVLIKKDLIDENKPDKDFYVTAGHMIKINQTETKAVDVKGSCKVTLEPQLVYSIATEKRCSILINGLDVMTWNFKKWEDFVANRKITWKDNLINCDKSINILE